MLKIDLTGRLAVITGATGQLGRVMAEVFGDCGADIAVHYHSNEQKARELVGEIRSKGRRADAFQADITDFESLKKLKANISDSLGEADIVVCNAVIQYPRTVALEQDIADFYSQFDSCVMHNVYMAKLFIPGMIEKRKGRFIAINTECSALCEPTFSAYSAAKRGLDGFIRCLAKEVGQYDITVNQVAPGWTISENDRLSHTEVQPGYDSTVPLRRRGTDLEIAQMAAFLASDLAGFTTGAYIPVSGGRVMPAI
ncbi:MAG: SDR family NAD(P)-dependent oxidoreductase [Oscillospiraceae bacterium]|nr:SDR family NAD(P)-dependent oxidoreductase [Oscillospiraceae bacterium]